jgi:PHD/YefM family antitoxin component YafN of YafNO toxin-antitoxin module
MYVLRSKEAGMATVSATKFRQNIFGYLSETINFNTPLHVTTKEGSAVVISEADYNALLETMYISSIPGLKEDIIDGMNTPLDECVVDEDDEW